MLGVTLGGNELDHHCVNSKTFISPAIELHFARDIPSSNEDRRAEARCDSHFGMRLGRIHGLHFPEYIVARKCGLGVACDVPVLKMSGSKLGVSRNRTNGRDCRITANNNKIGRKCSGRRESRLRG